ncbi:MAG: hypothetical protein J6D21_09480 [Clostridia bacterium]|nr:hypothetical protein [Clostridia bacterium]
MGAVFFVFFALSLMGVGFVAIAGGIVGLILCRKRRRDGVPLPEFVNVLFAILLIVGCVLFLLPIGFFAFIFLATPADPPSVAALLCACR